MDSYTQKNNYLRKYKLVNVNEGIDLMPFIYHKDLSYTKFEKAIDGKMSANSLSCTLKFPYSTKNVTVTTTEPMMIDAELLTNYMIDDDLFIGLETPKVTGQISLGNMFKKNDYFVLIETTENDLVVFEGILDNIKPKRDKTGIYISLSLKDKTHTMYRIKYKEDTLFKDVYLSNNNDKSNSLMHQLAYKMGFQDFELDLPTLSYTIPFVYLKKDNLIVKDFANATRLIGGVFTMEQGKLVIRAEENRITDNYVFDKRNILASIEVYDFYPSYEKLKVTYDYYFEKPLQDVWVLVGQNGTLDNANIVVLAGQKRKFEIKWLYAVDIVKDYEVYETLFKRPNGEQISFNYTLNITETGGTLEFNNTSLEDVYINKFKIRGKPLFMQSGNESYYPSNIDTELLLDLENPLVENENLALVCMKSNYNENCSKVKKLSFSTNINNYLEPSRKIMLNHEDFSGYIIIEKIDFRGEKMQIEAREYLAPVILNSIETLEKTSVDELEVISNKYLTEKGLYEKDKPSPPQNFTLISQALGFSIVFENFSQNLRGHWVFLRKKGETDFNRFFIATTHHFYQTTSTETFEVKLSALSINGVEGDATSIKEVTPIKLPSNNTEYPIGMSPSELNDLITINKSDIVSLKQVDDNHYSLIMQNKSEIILAVREDEIVTAINLSTEGIVIHGSRIALGSGLVVENGFVTVRELGAENIRAGAITVDHIAGKKFEGIEFISENTEKTERVYISYGKVVKEKRATINDEYVTYEKLLMFKVGEVRCQNDWSDVVDFKSCNGGSAWDFEVQTFIGNQYDLNVNGIATSREIRSEWVGNPSEQKKRYKVVGGFISNVKKTISINWVNNTFTLNNVTSIDFLYTIRSGLYTKKDWAGNFSYTGSQELFIRVNNQAEERIAIIDPKSYHVSNQVAEGVFSSSYKRSYGETPVTITLRFTTANICPLSYVETNGTPKVTVSSPSNSISGDYYESIMTPNKTFDATVKWIAIGNS